MVIDFSKIAYDSKPVLILRNLDGTAIGTLGFAFNVQAEFAYNEVSTLTFDLPKHANGMDVPHYDAVVGMRMIDLHGVGQFILVDPKETSDGIKTIKSCTAYSLEYEFAKKTITLESGTYNFWNPLQPRDTIIGRIMEKMPGWTVGEIDTDLVGKYRTFDVTENKIYDFMKSDVQESYGCIFEFDTYNRTVSAISANTDAEQKAVYLSDERLIQEIEIKEDSDSIVTCLDVNGADGVTIRSVNPTGTNKIYNLDYFMNTTNFSEDFIATWRRWETDYESYRDTYYNASMESNLYTMQKLTEEAALVDLQGELTKLENQQAATIQAISEKLQEESALTEINKEIAAKKKEIAAQKSKIAATEEKLKNVQKVLSGINASLAWDAKDENGNDIYFTQDELQILKKYFIEDSVQDSSFVAATTATYSNKDSSAALDNAQLRVTNSRIDSTDDNGNTTTSVTGGTLELGSLRAELIRATAAFRSDKSFVFTASLNKGTVGEAEFDSGNLTVIGSYKTKSESGAALSFQVNGGTMYFTKNTTAYEQHMVEWELYEYGRQVLAEKASPTYEFSIESGNFLAAEDFVSFKNELTLGKRVYLKLGDAEILKPYVVAVRINYEDATDFSLDFSSTYSTFNRQFKLASLLEQSVSLGKTLNAKSGVYEQFVSSGANSAVKNFMDSALDLAKNRVLSTGQQAIEFGDAGIRVRKWKTDGNGNQTTEFEPEEIWIVDNMIAFTNDNWNSAKMAIGKIFDESFGNYEKAKSTYDSSKVYYYRTGDKEPYTYQPYTYNSESWKTEWSKLYCRNGGTKYGIAAPYLVGTILAGRNLFINTDGGYFRVDDNGVYVLNEKFVIANPNGNGLTFTADEGLKHTVTIGDKTYEAGFSASNSNGEGYGLYFKVDGKKKLYLDVDKPELVVDGSIHAQKIFLGSDKTNIIERCDNEGINKISGDFIEGRGFRAYDNSGKERVVIDGETGVMTIKNGNINMEKTKDGIKRTIDIDPSKGLIFTSGGEERVKMDIKTGEIILGNGAKIEAPNITAGVFHVNGQGRDGGAAYYIQNGEDQCGYISFDNSGAGSVEEAKERVFFTTQNGVALKIQSDSNMSLSATGKIYLMSNTEIDGTLKVSGKEVVTTEDLENSYERLQTWVSNNFAKKSDIPTT